MRIKSPVRVGGNVDDYDDNQPTKDESVEGNEQISEQRSRNTMQRSMLTKSIVTKALTKPSATGGHQS